MLVLSLVLVLLLSWWLLHLLELSYEKKDGSFLFAASLVGVAIGAFLVVHHLLLNFYRYFNP
ncbi:hypothetical protein [Candidatus Cyanaurora vandensis]|uniref:hypothetical protein n=1 Tax=Candidatus Cyanaurora vandensis TaxID=2714958 RepID=UPI00257D34F2|nr:hypothetical protein [Candidatus Cyanaurora vandensis]